MVSNTRLYGASIAGVSASYSLWSASMATQAGPSSLLMAALGVVVLVHGALLLTPSADRLGNASGPLMVAYAAVMLLNQALLGTGMTNDGMMGYGGMNGGAMGMNGSMGWDPGMVSLAVLMLASGVIMTQSGRTEGM